jgi:hypothetical protein
VNILEKIMRQDSLSFEELISSVKNRKLDTYYTFTLDLATARDNILLPISGGLIQVVDETSRDLTATCQISLDAQHKKIPFYLGTRLVSTFSKLFFTNDAQAGKKFTFAIATEFKNLFDYSFFLSFIKLPIYKFTATIIADASWDNEAVPIWQAPLSIPIKIIQVNAVAMGSSTPKLKFNLEERAWLSLKNAGTDVFASDQEADENGIEITSFSNLSIAPKAHLVFTTGASAKTSGTVDLITLTVYFTL